MKRASRDQWGYPEHGYVRQGRLVPGDKWTGVWESLRHSGFHAQRFPEALPALGRVGCRRGRGLWDYESWHFLKHSSVPSFIHTSIWFLNYPQFALNLFRNKADLKSGSMGGPDYCHTRWSGRYIRHKPACKMLPDQGESETREDKEATSKGRKKSSWIEREWKEWGGVSNGAVWLPAGGWVAFIQL